MSPNEVLRDRQVSPAVAWEALISLFGEDVLSWEPDTFAITLERRRVPPTAALMTKLLAAQTLLTTGDILRDHEAFFAFALACDGIPHGYDEFAHPTPAQLAWAVCQIEAIAKKKLTEESGFDPDEIDPAVAVVLYDAGFFIAPTELSFAQSILTKMSHIETEKLEQYTKAWNALYDKRSTKQLKALADQLPENRGGVQLRRLADVVIHVREQREHNVHLGRASEISPSH